MCTFELWHTHVLVLSDRISICILQEVLTIEILQQLDLIDQVNDTSVVLVGASSDTDKATVYYSVAAGDSSHIYCGDTDGHHNEIFCLESQTALLGLFWLAAKSQLVSVATTGDLCIHGEEEEGGGWQQIEKMKIGGGAGPEGPALMVAWVGDQTLASASGRDDVVRLYDLDTEDNYILRLGACVS